MGLTFKENCSDTRNSKVLDLYNHFKKRKLNISTYDPHSSFWDNKFKKKYNVINSYKNQKFDIVIVAVKHNKFIRAKSLIRKICSKYGFIYDLKYIFPQSNNIYRL